MQEKDSKKKQNRRLIITIVTAVVLVGIIQFYFYKGVDEVNVEVKELVGKYNKNCPLAIQEGIRLDSVSLLKNKEVQYNLTLVHVEKETADVNVINKEIEKSLISTAKANPGLQVFRDNDYALIYSYSDRKKVFLFKVVIAPDQYK
ncbi:hypothetical protein GKZ90_0020290 [Flavobacterium sp. MC2016-06]|jgi:hypothetical protein|uniref:hypothetical protein n=1 Tax=Flavobacterium sp. MC2016-06 TaxID=2676308 RepID=UPI0012BAF740|nr:hypothetical protein [Flavobacterium sp. MC2016-06]MBU3860933.1 hypothetical protein [Flavobacterium sp. MC2016-06]